MTAHPMAPKPLADEASRVVGAARLAYVAIDTKRGPLVTPVLYGTSGRSTWFLTNRHALKTKMLRRDNRVAWVISDGPRSAVMTGTARLMSASRLDELTAAFLHALTVKSALTSWGTRNPRQVFGFMRDALTNPSRVMPQDQVFVELRPDTTSFVELPESSCQSSVAPLRHTAALPVHLRPLLTSTTGVLGIRTPDGPLALPVCWDPSLGIATLPAGHATGDVGTSAPACVTFDEPVKTRATEQRGVVLRGHARLCDGGTAFALETSRITYWDGFITRTITIPSN